MKASTFDSPSGFTPSNRDFVWMDNLGKVDLPLADVATDTQNINITGHEGCQISCSFKVVKSP